MMSCFPKTLFIQGIGKESKGVKMSTIDLQVKDVNASGLSAWMRQHPIIAYFTLAFAGAWVLQMPMVLGTNGLGIFSYAVPDVLFIILFFLSVYAGPTLSAFLVTNALDGKEGRRKLFRRYGQWRVGLPWYALAIFGFPIIYLIAGSIVLGGVPLADLRANWTTFFSPYLLAVLIFPAFLTWGEEPGWRGFALTRMQKSYHPLLATVIVGFFHALWHLPVFIYVSGPIPLGPFDLPSFALNTLVTIATAILFTWVFNNARGSILIAVLVHASLNATPAWMSALIPNYPEAAAEIVRGIYFVAAIALILMTRGRLGYSADPSEKTE
jgi:membrane protease YdiL (CAAX protease family)